MSSEINDQILVAFRYDNFRIITASTKSSTTTVLFFGGQQRGAYCTMGYSFEAELQNLVFDRYIIYVPRK